MSQQTPMAPPPPDPDNPSDDPPSIDDPAPMPTDPPTEPGEASLPETPPADQADAPEPPATPDATTAADEPAEAPMTNASPITVEISSPVGTEPSAAPADAATPEGQTSAPFVTSTITAVVELADDAFTPSDQLGTPVGTDSSVLSSGDAALPIQQPFQSPQMAPQDQPATPEPPLSQPSSTNQPAFAAFPFGSSTVNPLNQMQSAYSPGLGAPLQSSSQPTKKRTGLIILVGVLVLALAAFGIYWFVLRNANPDVHATTTPTDTTPAVTPDSTVQNYLQALASGDATTALTYAATPPSNPTFLTNQVLSASIAAGAITNIAVTPDPAGDQTQAHVAARYNIGSKSVSTTYDVKLYGNKYLIVNATRSVDLSIIFTPNIGMALNGVSMDRSGLSSVDLLPGSYQFTSTNPLLLLNPDHFVIADTNTFPSITTSPILSDTAQATLAAAAKSSLDSCLKEKAIVTGCRFGFTGLEGNATPNLNTITWKITSGSDDFSKTDFRQASGAPTTAGADVNIKIRCNVKDMKGNQYQASISLGIILLDFSDPNDIKVTFTA